MNNRLEIGARPARRNLLKFATDSLLGRPRDVEPVYLAWPFQSRVIVPAGNGRSSVLTKYAKRAVKAGWQVLFIDAYQPKERGYRSERALRRVEPEHSMVRISQEREQDAFQAMLEHTLNKADLVYVPVEQHDELRGLLEVTEVITEHCRRRTMESRRLLIILSHGDRALRPFPRELAVVMQGSSFQNVSFIYGGADPAPIPMLDESVDVILSCGLGAELWLIGHGAPLVEDEARVKLLHPRTGIAYWPARRDITSHVEYVTLPVAYPGPNETQTDRVAA